MFQAFNSDGDGIKGLTIDKYKDYLLVQYFNEHIGGELAEDGKLGKDIISVSSKLHADCKGILIKNRIQYKGKRDYVKLRRSIMFFGEMPPKDYIVKQNGIFAYVDLIDGMNTGIFLDMREIRDALNSFYKRYRGSINAEPFLLYSSFFCTCIKKWY